MSTLASAIASLGYNVDSSGNPVIETPLAPARPNPSATSLPNTDTLQGAIASLTGTAQNAASSGATGLFGSLETWLTSSATNIVAVLIGLVLVAGAVWGFDQVRETVVSTAKGAAELAA